MWEKFSKMGPTWATYRVYKFKGELNFQDRKTNPKCLTAEILYHPYVFDS